MDEGPVVGIDIGGKNVKYTVLIPEDEKYLVNSGIIPSMFMKMELQHILTQLVTHVPEDTSCVGVTMSFPVGYRDFQEGVKEVVQILVSCSGSTPVMVVDFEGNLWSLRDSLSQDPVRFSASNFFGSAFLASKICDNSIMIDTGSTSTDIICIRKGCPVLLGRDTSNLKRNSTGEMTWTGIIHTLVSSLTHLVPLRGRLVRASPSGATTNDVYNVLSYDEMRSLLRLSKIEQKEPEHYSLGLASLFGYDLKSVESVEVETIARFVSLKHREVLAESLLQVLSGHRLPLEETDFVIMGLGKDILVRRMLGYLEIPESHIRDVQDYVQGDSWFYGSSLGVSLRILDYITKEKSEIMSIKEVKDNEINVVGNNS
jgi:probable H4MPT-linked C1 transfer pathway protein